MIIDKNKEIQVVNKYNGIVGYSVPDSNIHRNWYPNETKTVIFDELEKVSFAPGGLEILTDYLEIKDAEAVKVLFNHDVEPEYHYSREDIKQIMQVGTLDQFLDCLDFAPAAVREIIKDLAVELPLNDVAKREAVLEKLNFDVTKAIEIQNTKLDGGNEDTQEMKTTNRRAAPLNTNNSASVAPSGRRYKAEGK